MLVPGSALLLVLASVLAAPLFFSAEYASAGMFPTYIEPTTDRGIYIGNETITISGTVRQDVLDDDTELMLEVHNPKDEIYLTDRIPVNSDGSFSYSLKIEGRLGIPGGYRYYLTLPDLGTVGAGFVYISQPLQLKVDGTSYPITYRSQGEILNITVDAPSRSLTVYTNNSSGLEITLPRDVIDSKDVNSQDSKFRVIVNENEVDANEMSSDSSSRTLYIRFHEKFYDSGRPFDVTRITIFGTSVIPEFSSSAGIISVLAAGSLVIGLRFARLLSFQKARLHGR